MKLAPVIIFNYNRPDHSMRTWEALSHNTLAAETELYLYCDGPKEVTNEGVNELTSERARKNCSLVQMVQTQAKQYAIDAEKAGKFKAVHVKCAEHNKGLANSIIGGVTDVINKHGRVIVLEDDLLTSPYFLKYMNEALNKYESYPSVFSIGGYNFPLTKMAIPQNYPYDVYVSIRFSSWGWATWKNKWNSIDWSLDYFEDFIKHQEQIEAFNRGGDDLTEMLTLQRDGKIDSWAIRYAFQHFYHHAVTILPCVSYVDNIGIDGSGIHCGKDDGKHRNNVSLAPANPRWLDVLYEDKRIINAFYAYCSPARLSMFGKASRKICKMLGIQAPAYATPKVYA